MNYTINNYDAEALCIQDMAANNQPINGPLIVNNGRFNRYSSDRNQSKKDEWYIAWTGITSWEDEYLICVYGSWSLDSKHVFKNFNNSATYSTSQKQELNNLLQEKIREAEQQLIKARNTAAQQAAEIWAQATDQPPSEEYSQYLKTKGIVPTKIKYGLCYDKYASMILDIRNANDEIRSLQYIYIDEYGKFQKRFLSGGEKTGNFHIIGSAVDNGLLYIAEGYATAVSVHTATNAPTVVAFGAGNLESVTKNIKNKYPHSTIVMAGDNGDAGIEKATEAAKKFGCKVVFPQFPEDKKFDTNGKLYTDFNDLHQVAGAAEVTRQLQLAVSIKTYEEELKELAQSLNMKEDPCEDFDVSDLPEPLRDYVVSLCKETDAHPIMITSAILVTVSAFVKTDVYISKPDYYQNLYLNLWILCVAQSGQYKTTALNAGSEIALEKQSQVFNVIKEIDREIELTPDGAQKLELKARRLNESIKNVILPIRSTAEGLIRQLAQGHKGAIYASEFGAWLQNLAKTHNNDLKGIFTDLYDVPANWRNLTKTQGDDILEKPFISICGCCAVQWLKKTIEEDDVATGFLARFLIFTPLHENTISAGLPRATEHSRKIAKERFETILRNILADIGEGRRFTLSQEAKHMFENADDNEGLHQKINIFVQSQDEKTQEILAPFAKRWSPYLLKLGMIMQLFYDAQSTEISQEALESASFILLASMKSTAYLFKRELGESEFQHKCRVIMEFICKRTRETGKPVERRMIISSKRLKGGVKEYDSVLNTLIDEGKLIAEDKKPKSLSLYIVMPAIENE